MKKCPFCAEEIQDEAIICKHCKNNVAANASASTAMKSFKLSNEKVSGKQVSQIIGGAIIVLIVWYIGSTLSKANKQDILNNTVAKQQAASAPAITVTAVTLSKEYTANEVAADQKYKGKMVEVSGVVDSIGKDIGNTPYITLKGDPKNVLANIQCMFGKEYQDRLAKISKGQQLSVIGTVSGKMINVLLQDCRL